MPIYEFTCPLHGRFERIFKLALFDEIKDGIRCGKLIDINDDFYCVEIAVLEWSIPANIQIGLPTRVFINRRTGETYTPASRYEKPPRGYFEKSLKGPIERSKFEKEEQKRVDEKNQVTSMYLDSLKDERRKRRHDDLKARMNAVQVEQDEKGNRIEYTLDHKDKALLKKAMTRSKKRPAREKKSDVMLAVNQHDASNLSEIK